MNFWGILFLLGIVIIGLLILWGVAKKSAGGHRLGTLIWFIFGIIVIICIITGKCENL